MLPTVGKFAMSALSLCVTSCVFAFYIVEQMCLVQIVQSSGLCNCKFQNPVNIWVFYKLAIPFSLTIFQSCLLLLPVLITIIFFWIVCLS